VQHIPVPHLRAFPVQMWHRGGPSPNADVAQGAILALVQMRHGSPSSGADVKEVGRVPVQMWRA
jgi:hypothetical protein